MLSKYQIYGTSLGIACCGDSLELLDILPNSSVNLVVTSPPFALVTKKAYGNESQEQYVNWLAGFAEKVKRVLKEDGSFVIDLGGAYNKGTPTRSLYNYKVLIKLCDELGFHLAQEFFFHNPATLPGPIEWVNKRKIRAKSSVNTVWWLSKSPFPKANIESVLTEYTASMKRFLNSKKQFNVQHPSGHIVTDSMRKNNGGAIPSNLLQIANTSSNDSYNRLCKEVGAIRHPARFPAKFPEFFIKFLTAPGDLVLDIFAGSNTTGFVSEQLNRRWISLEKDFGYVASSILRFKPETIGCDPIKRFYELAGKNADVSTK